MSSFTSLIHERRNHYTSRGPFQGVREEVEKKWLVSFTFNCRQNNAYRAGTLFSRRTQGKDT
jgi:hypothetical protein